jgi:hypothetical protein
MGGETPGRFAADFRRLVAPVLRSEVNRLAGHLADDRLTFPEAVAELMHLAHARGAGFLPDVIHSQLRDWLSSTLLSEACLALEADALVQRLLREPRRDAMRKAIREFLGDE